MIEENRKPEKVEFGRMPSGEKVYQYVLTNSRGMKVKIISYGGRITSIEVPDKEGNFKNVVLGLDSLEEYLEESAFLGALIGRFGNRICKGRFSLDGREYKLATNNGDNHLHGGDRGFDKVLWEVEKGSASNSLKLTYTSPDMEEGYPGNLLVSVIYSLKDDNTLDVIYKAETDRKTIVNLTQHSYFNLSGDFSQKILDHEVQINADEFIPIDNTSIPTGKINEVAGTPFDFRQPKILGKEISANNEQIKNGIGFDHCWVLNDQDNGIRFAASALHPESGRKLEVFTTEPGMQLYTGNFLDGTLPMQYEEGYYERRTGFCFETQHYPDSPNHPEFPSVVLEPGEEYNSKTSFKFSIE